MGAVTGAGERAFITDYEGEDLAAVGQIAENEPEAAEVAGVGKILIEVFSGEIEFVVEDTGFEDGDAAETPAGYGQGAD